MKVLSIFLLRDLIFTVQLYTSVHRSQKRRG